MKQKFRKAVSGAFPRELVSPGDSIRVLICPSRRLSTWSLTGVSLGVSLGNSVRVSVCPCPSAGVSPGISVESEEKEGE